MTTNFTGGGNCTLDHLQSQSIKWLRFPMSLLVVFIHYYGKEITFENTFENSFYDYIRIFLCHVVSHAAVPTFFVISGYYFFYNTRFNLLKYKLKLKKRVKTLFVPYILWNTILLTISVTLKIFTFYIKGKPFNIIDFCYEKGWIDIFWSCNEWVGRTNWLGVQSTNTAPLLVPMWFIRDLIIVVLFTPIIHWCLTKSSKYFLTLLFFIYISNIWINIPGFSNTALFYFSLGSFFAIKKKNIISEFVKVKKLTYYLIIPFLVVMTYFDGRNTSIGNYLYPFFIIILVSAYFNIAIFMVKHHHFIKFAKWGKASFFIFALHTIYMLSISETIISQIIPSNFWVLAIFRHILIPITCVIICYGVFLFMRRFMPKLLSLLTGDRGQ